MPNFGYTRDVPFPDHNPSTDQPDMLINTNSTDSIIAVDHFSFEDNFGGTHKQVQLKETPPGNGAIPVGLQGNTWETIYSSVPTGGVGELYFVRGASATGIQLTGPGTPTINPSDGFTFLPGGLLLQWGKKSSASDGTVVTYPKPFFSNAFSVQVSFAVAAGTLVTVNVGGGVGTDNTKFTIRMYNGANLDVYWIAIGR